MVFARDPFGQKVCHSVCEGRQCLALSALN